MTGEQILERVQRVAGVVGSFVADDAGSLCLRLLPERFSEAALSRTAVRVGSMVRRARLCELDVERCDLCWGDYELSVWRFDGRMLGVLAESSVSRHALSRAARLALDDLRSWLVAQPGDFDDEVTARCACSD